MKAYITGCAGFIGSNMVQALLAKGWEVIGVDNFTTGRKEFIDKFSENNNFKFFNIDLCDQNKILDTIIGSNYVFHFSANADVRNGLKQPIKDLEQNTIVTSNILEAMRKTNIKDIIFSSTGSIYGEPEIFPTPENAPFPVQTSLYGASKIAGESLITSYCNGFGFNSWIFRFVSILGENYTHGHVYDFYKSLKKDKSKLTVLGNGKQRKSYLYIKDCIEAIIHSLEIKKENINILNLGTNEACTVNDSISWICDEMKCNPSLNYTGGERGWIGDSPFILLDTKKINDTGWKPKLTIEESVRKTVQFFKKNDWLFD